jgi:hypothetical protein
MNPGVAHFQAFFAASGFGLYIPAVQHLLDVLAGIRHGGIPRGYAKTKREHCLSSIHFI